MTASDAPAPALDLTADPVEITRAICDVPSVSGDEATLADLIERALAPAAHLEVLRDGDAVVARTDLGRARRVVIAGHIDTVPINRNLPTRFETIDGVEYLWGRGTVDMKAGVAVQLKLALELVAPAVDVTWMWYDHEEVAADLNGLGRLAAHRPELFAGDFAILGEPSNGAVEGGCNGNVRVELRARGLRAHSARSWVGENAIHRLAPALERLAAYEAQTVEVDGLAYREGLNAVGVSGGVAGNVIPDEATLAVNYRFAPSKTADEAIAHVRELFGEYELTVVDRAEGARPGLDAALAQEFVAAVGAEAKPKYGWTDVARFSAMGIPAVNFGPGDPLKAHADDERVPLHQIRDCDRALRAWLNGD
ncbi:succinyl-diaminopimelate desuccinylase [Agromyces rhizosphaerae]|uniref:Succinyl-diaminopimelate desuccinylase n=1 Tax=Agromyces rhizosphaerae TaxID=88374 RepID=A0A9W6CYN1_9MICO|nr:succinyl-diaminopimelate desuccinylase [Agromyces rhizosphaerae]GLI28416.1 succinyl-diaminopimelate desuccinylase [Agromyces rhizosphaerae]